MRADGLSVASLSFQLAVRAGHVVLTLGFDRVYGKAWIVA
jgi:hypothetical protein